jgi:hypothetical protein
MSCRVFRKRIESGFKHDGYEISGDLLEHVKICDSCSDYLRDLKLLRDNLIQSRLDVLPGELDDITFEKVISEVPEAIGHSVRYSRRIKWLLGPAIVGLATVLVILLAGRGGINVSENRNNYVDSYPSIEIDSSLLASDSLSIEVLSLMAVDDASLDRVDDELLRQSDIDEMLSNLTPDELKALYDKIDNFKG